MDLLILARGAILGFSIAAVVGPIALLCIRRTLTAGFSVGFVSGLGAATADASYAAIAGFGISAVASVLVDQRLWLRVVGGLFLVYLALRTLWAAPAERAADHRSSSLRLVGAYSSTLALTLSNPMTILSFAGIFAGLGLGSLDQSSTVSALGLVLGVFGGSAAWWLVLASVTIRLRGRITPRGLRLVNIGSGAVILAFGIQSLVAAGFST
ncbi:MAG: LysE family transporter [Chloroflexi bacterium]|nr:LysE family transporter [Chloroflexota bacterium]